MIGRSFSASRRIKSRRTMGDGRNSALGILSIVRDPTGAFLDASPDGIVDFFAERGTRRIKFYPIKA